MWLTGLVAPRHVGSSRSRARTHVPCIGRQILFFFFFKLLGLFIYLFMVVLGLRFCARAFPSHGERGPLLIAARGPPTIAASPAAEHRLQTRRLSKLWLTGLVAPRHAGSSQTRARTRFPRIGRQTLNHCTTREAPVGRFLTTVPPGKPPWRHFGWAQNSLSLGASPWGSGKDPITQQLFIGCLY